MLWVGKSECKNIFPNFHYDIINTNNNWGRIFHVNIHVFPFFFEFSDTDMGNVLFATLFYDIQLDQSIINTFKYRIEQDLLIFIDSNDQKLKSFFGTKYFWRFENR